ncbi:Tic22 family protein [Leptolyngbya sp. AN03gr2]|uniref:Tic22 family protein n=1 Tax=unclassified Leptolyngbya TaxID=2650499 RepID=UPI003D322B92
MKSLVRWSTTAAMVGGTLLAGLQALALTPEQITQKLRAVPVFTIANTQGAPLVAQPPNGQKGNPVAGVFISQKDANAFLENLRSRNPALAKDVRVVPVSLAEVYQLNQGAQGRQEKLDFAYVPAKQQLDAALAILKANGQQATQFNGTPLFVARAGKDKGFLTIQEGNQSVIPMFFNKEDLQPLVERFKQQKPDLAATVDIQVFPLEGVMQAMQREKDPQLDKIVLIPPRETLEFVQRQQQQQPQQQRPQQTQQRPQQRPQQPAAPKR